MIEIFVKASFNPFSSYIHRLTFKKHSMSLVMQPCDLEQDMTTLFESPEQTTELTNSPQRLLDEIVHSRPNEMVETRSDDENLSVAQNIVQRMKILVQPELGEIDESNEEMKNFALVKKNPEAEEMEL